MKVACTYCGQPPLTETPCAQCAWPPPKPVRLEFEISPIGLRQPVDEVELTPAELVRERISLLCRCDYCTKLRE